MIAIITISAWLFAAERRGPLATPVSCRFLSDEPTGTSATFNCVLDGGDVVKVKYSRNAEIHAEVAATRPSDRAVPSSRCSCCG